MSIIRVEHLTFSYPFGFDNIFEDVSLQLDTDWRLGFVGRNGRGKTTFLKLLSGEYAYRGRITASVSFDYFPYAVKDRNRIAGEILEEICPAAQAWELRRELSQLAVEEEALYRPFETLSKGEQTKMLLAALFLNEGRFLLIDEPTSHLDAASRKQTAAYLRRKKGFILVSHDRSFLDGCVDHILALNKSNIEVQKGNFSSWAANFEKQQEKEVSRNEQLLKDIRHLTEAARRGSAWSEKTESGKFGRSASGLKADRGYVGHKAAKMMKRSKAAENRMKQAAEEKSGLLKNLERREKLKLSPLVYRADVLADFSEVSVNYDGRTVCGPVSFTVKRGERIALEGRNGSGKSSLLKLLTGNTDEVSYTGSISAGSGLIISYVPQDTSFLPGSLSDFAGESKIDETQFKTILRKMGFSRVQFEKNLEALSAGQKKKVLLARSLCESAHLYIWDEPLNYVDIDSRIQIEQVVRDFSPTMIFVEHDSLFRERIATEFVKL